MSQICFIPKILTLQCMVTYSLQSRVHYSVNLIKINISETQQKYSQLGYHECSTLVKGAAVHLIVGGKPCTYHAQLAHVM